MKVSILGLLGVVLVTLKLAEVGVVATWSWVWVLAPFWIGFAVLGVIGLLMLTGFLIAHKWK